MHPWASTVLCRLYTVWLGDGREQLRPMWHADTRAYVSVVLRFLGVMLSSSSSLTEAHGLAHLIHQQLRELLQGPQGTKWHQLLCDLHLAPSFDAAALLAWSSQHQYTS